MLAGRIELSKMRAGSIAARMNADMETRIEQCARSTEYFHERLRASDPGRIMSMGYAALLSDSKNITSVTDISPGDKVTAVLSDGHAELTVGSIFQAFRQA
jgi:exonuclease VII large subunit